MRRTIFTRFKGLFFTAVIAAAVLSCEDEKPQVIFPDNPEVPDNKPSKEFKYFEAFTEDTLYVDEGQAASLRFRTVPWNLIKRDSTTLELVNPADTTAFKYATAGTPVMQKDSTWVISISLLYGCNSGDTIALALKDKDTVFVSDPMVIHIIPAPAPTSFEINRASGDVSAYEAGGKASVRFRTVPWNLLLDSAYTFTVTDTLGQETDMFNVSPQVEFQPDSTWLLQVDLSSATAKVGYGMVRLNVADTTLLSEKFRIEKVSFAISYIRVKGYSFGTDTNDPSRMTYYDDTKTFSCIMPAVTDYRNQELRIVHTGDKLTQGDSLLESRTTKYNTFNLNNPVVISLWKYDIHKEYTLTMTNTGLPVVRITSSKAMNQYDRINWVDGAIMRIEYPDGTVDFEDTLSLKGRGNGTWTETEKKPFAIKLNEKAKLLGMHKQKRWILLANYKDRTLLRNDAAYWLSRQAYNSETGEGMPYTINGQFVELVWNGEHKGNYYLCEQARIDNHRVDIANPDLENPEMGGFFVEIDTYLGYYSSYEKNPDIGFWSSKFNLPYIFKDPDESQITTSSKAYKYFKNYVEEFETILKNDTRLKNHEYENYLDVDKAIDYALIQELTLNHDSYNTWPKDGPHSAFLYKDSAGLLCYGPVWDFDYHTFMPTCKDNDWSSVDLAKEWVLLSTSAKTSSGKYYFEYLLKDPKFKNRLIERWDMHKDTWKQLPEYIDMMADSIRVSESFNWKIWGLRNPNGDQNKDKDLGFQGAVDRMKQGFNNRWDWLDDKIHKL